MYPTASELQPSYRPILIPAFWLRFFSKRIKEVKQDRMIGKKGIVTKTVRPGYLTGRIEVEGISYSALCKTKELKPGCEVEIIRAHLNSYEVRQAY